MGRRNLAERALADETLREPLPVTCFIATPGLTDEPTFSVAMPLKPVYSPPDEGDTGYLTRRPERVFVGPVPSPRPLVRATPIPLPRRPIERAPQAPVPKISRRSDTVRSLPPPERLQISSLMIFWGVALLGSLAAIGAALASW